MRKMISRAASRTPPSARRASAVQLRPMLLLAAAAALIDHPPILRPPPVQRASARLLYGSGQAGPVWYQAHTYESVGHDQGYAPGYEGYGGLFRAAGLHHARIRAQRPPADVPHWRANASEPASVELDQARCARTPECRLFYRSSSALHFGRGELCAALRKSVAAARERPSVCA